MIKNGKSDVGTHRLMALRVLAIALGLATSACAVATHPGGQPIRQSPVPEASTQRATAVARNTAAEPQLAPLSASFISATTGWLLGQSPCGNEMNGCHALLLRKTSDGGRSWRTLPKPPIPAAGSGLALTDTTAVNGIVFANARVGWAYGPGLYITRDGGMTWRRIRIGAPVQGLAYGHGRVLAAVGSCKSPDGRSCRFRVLASAPQSDSWQRLPGSGLSGWSSPASLLIVGRMAYAYTVSAATLKTVLLTGPADGSAAWHQIQSPCLRGWSMALASSPGGWLLAGCGSEPGAGEQLKTAYLSRDGGRTWRRLANPPASGYLADASMTAGGTIFLSGGRMDIYISRDRGRSWHTSPSLDSAAGMANAGFTLAAVTTGNRTGFAYQSGVYRNQIWITTNRGLTWTPVTVR